MSATLHVGVLLANTGTPSAPTAGAVRRFLRPFLSDPRVVELPRWLWLPLLNGVILPLRAPRSARNYRRVWQDGGSPLAVNTAALREALELELAARLGADAVSVVAGNLYAATAIATALHQLHEAGARRFVVLPLYPQASGTTTGAVWDQLGRALGGWRSFPQLHFVADYHDQPLYIGALADSVREHWHRHGRTEHLLMSFHGIPEAYVQKGDAYAAQCRHTAGLLAQALQLPADAWSLSFQSRFGRARWLTPATDSELKLLPSRGVRALSVICPGFALDCIETLEEINIGGRELFLHAGGEQFQYVPALNGRADHARALAELVCRCAGSTDHTAAGS